MQTFSPYHLATWVRVSRAPRKDADVLKRVCGCGSSCHIWRWLVFAEHGRGKLWLCVIFPSDWYLFSNTDHSPACDNPQLFALRPSGTDLIKQGYLCLINFLCTYILSSYRQLMHLEEANLSFYPGLPALLKAILFFKPDPHLISSLVDLFLCLFPVLNLGSISLLWFSPEQASSCLHSYHLANERLLFHFMFTIHLSQGPS